MKKIKTFLASVIVASVLVGCGGNDSGTTKTSGTSFRGTAAIGLGISTQIQILDVPTCQITNIVSDSNGYFESGDISTTTGPYILKATSSLGFNLYSYINKTEDNVVNITPLTHYVMDASSRAGTNSSISSLYGSCNEGIENFNSFQSQLPTQTQTLLTTLQNSFGENEYASENPFNVPFEANQTGYDALLDNIDMSLNNNDTFIRLGGTILETSNDEISAEANFTASGKVIDSSGIGLDDVNVIIGLRSEAVEFTPSELKTTSGGVYSTTLESYRNYVIKYSKDGYNTVTQYLDTFNPNVSLLDVVLYTTTEINNMTKVSPSISIIDSRNGGNISDVTIKVREGFNNKLGEVVAEYVSSSAQALSILPGTYTFELIKEGYYSDFVTVNILPSTSILNFDLLSISSSTTVSSEAFGTIILRWGENPRDLDSHLSFGDSEVAFYNGWVGALPEDRNNPCATEGVIASLDLDDVTSYGPETTSICDGTKGPFTFKIHHYSGISNIGASPTSVELITRDGSKYEFIAPTNVQYSNSRTDLWNVFTLNGDQTVTINNTIENGQSLDE